MHTIVDMYQCLFTVLDDVINKDLPIGIDAQEGRVPNDHQQSLRSSQRNVEPEDPKINWKCNIHRYTCINMLYVSFKEELAQNVNRDSLKQLPFRIL